MPMTLEEVNKKQQDFTKLLIKTPLEKYTPQLWEAFQAVACDALDFSNIIEEIADKARARLEAATSVAQQLLPLLNNEPVKIGKTKVTSTDALEALKSALFEEYKAFGMNRRQMTPEEAKDILKDWRNDKNTENWIEEQLVIYSNENGLTGEEAMISEEDFDTFSDEPSNVEYYAELSEVIEEVTPEQVEEQIKLNTFKRKQGRKSKRTNLAWLILEIRRYYKGHRNEDYRLIFDCMDLFDLIDEKVKKAWNKKNDKELKAAKTSYIKSAIYKPALRYETDTQPTLQAKYKGIGMEFHDTL